MAKITRWFSELPKVETISVPRSFKVDRKKMTSHVFSDASVRAYGSAVNSTKMAMCV